MKIQRPGMCRKRNYVNIRSQMMRISSNREPTTRPNHELDNSGSFFNTVELIRLPLIDNNNVSIVWMMENTFVFCLIVWKRSLNGILQFKTTGTQYKQTISASIVICCDGNTAMRHFWNVEAFFVVVVFSSFLAVFWIQNFKTRWMTWWMKW